MKTIKLIFAFILIINCSGFSQDDKFVCKYDDWADRHNENEKWNSLLDQACKEINSGNYKQAIHTLDQAMAIDSASNGGDVNVFIETQYRRLRDFVENSPALTASAGTEKPVATQETPSDNSAKEKKLSSRKIQPLL
ncbi:MAG: hypothetical protein IPP71_09680 [Bacteroidetes bacterium]|nr:hypothetical protein [Bacteroidota bacterium]